MRPAEDTTTHLTHPQVVCTTSVLRRVKPGRVIRLVGGMGAVRYCKTHTRSTQVALRGLMERVYYVKAGDGFAECPAPTDRGMTRLGIVRDALVKVLPKAGPPLSDVDCVATFQGSRRKRMETARLSLLERPLDARDFRLSSFVKAEKWNKDSAPRLIQAWGPRATLRLARYLKPIEKRVYKGLDEICGERVVFKGLNGEQRAAGLREKWDRFTSPVAIGMDASRFDQHVSVQALQLEHSVYMHMYSNCSELGSILRKQLRSYGIIVCDDGVIRYTVNGKRCSGHMNTSLGNVTLMVLMCLSYVHSLGWRLGREISLANDGDDCVFMMEKKHEARFRGGLDAYFLEFGFEMACEETVSVFERIEFCQSRPVWACGRWVMVRNPAKCLQHDLHFIDFQESMIPKVVNAIGYCGGSLYTGMPVLQSFYAALRSAPLDKAILADQRFCRSALYTLSHTANAVVAPVSEEARVSFWRAWGIDPSTQILLESQYAKAQPTYDYRPFVSKLYEREKVSETQILVHTFLN